MQQPKKPKYRKAMKRLRHIRGVETRGCKLHLGDYGLRVLESGWLTDRQLEAGRVAIARSAKRGGMIQIRAFPDKPITRKPAETRMGSGKGATEFWVAEVRAGRILYEITGVDAATAKEALTLAASKMPFRCAIVSRSATLL